MKLSDIKKPGEVLTFTGPEGQKATLTVRNANSEFLMKGRALTEEVRKRLGLAPGEPIPPTEDIAVGLKARVGTYVPYWDGWDDDQGNPIPVRLEDGSYNDEGGASILAIQEVLDELQKELNRQQVAQIAAIEAAAKNSGGPSPVN